MCITCLHLNDVCRFITLRNAYINNLLTLELDLVNESKQMIAQ